MHATLDCTAATSAGSNQGTARNLHRLHMPDYQKASNPNHLALGLAKDCSSAQHIGLAACELQSRFGGFPSDWRPREAECEQCHTNGNFNLTSTHVISCPFEDYQGPTIRITLRRDSRTVRGFTARSLWT